MIKRDELPGKPDALSLIGLWLYNTTNVKGWTVSVLMAIAASLYVFPLASALLLKWSVELYDWLFAHPHPDLLMLVFTCGAVGAFIAMIVHTLLTAGLLTVMKWAGWRIISRKR